MNPDDQLPDLYKLPPMTFQAFDEWKKESNDVSPSLSEPEPDYSDDDSNHDDLAGDGSDPDYEPSAPGWQEQRDKLQDQLAVLTRDQYNNIVAIAEASMPAVDIPEPDYLDQDDPGDSPPGSPSYSSSIMGMAPSETNGSVVEPKKLVNPVLESRERQQLHKELMLNQKLGIDVLHQKSELKKEMERRQNNQKRKELEEYHRHKRTSLEVKLEEQANKLKETSDGEKPKDKKSSIPEEVEAEFLKIHSKINRTKLDS